MTKREKEMVWKQVKARAIAIVLATKERYLSTDADAIARVLEREL